MTVVSILFPLWVWCVCVCVVFFFFLFSHIFMVEMYMLYGCMVEIWLKCFDLRASTISETCKMKGKQPSTFAFSLSSRAVEKCGSVQISQPITSETYIDLR